MHVCGGPLFANPVTNIENCTLSLWPAVMHAWFTEMKSWYYPTIILHMCNNEIFSFWNSNVLYRFHWQFSMHMQCSPCQAINTMNYCDSTLIRWTRAPETFLCTVQPTWKPMFVCLYIFLSFRIHMRLYIISLYTINEGYREPTLNL